MYSLIHLYKKIKIKNLFMVIYKTKLYCKEKYHKIIYLFVYMYVFVLVKVSMNLCFVSASVGQSSKQINKHIRQLFLTLCITN